MSFVHSPAKIDKEIYLTSSSGANPEEVYFIYFLYYLGLYPVAFKDISEITTKHGNEIFSKDWAKSHLAEYGDELIMEIGWTTRSGGHLTRYLLLLDAYLKGLPIGNTFRTSSIIMFIISLLALFYAFWWIGQPLLGILAVMFVGSNPFQLFEVYYRDNIFGWVISIAIIMLALYLPLMNSKPPSKYYVWGLALLSGILLATVLQIRTEPGLIVLGCLFIFLTLSQYSWRSRITLILLLIITFMGTSQAWRMFFRMKFNQAYEVVKNAGGHVYDGPWDNVHNFWHPIWCGLGDFGQQYGYTYNDVSAANYAVPILIEKYGMNSPLKNKGDDYYYYLIEDWYDDAKLYRVYAHWLPHYEEVLRNRILNDLRRNPDWFILIGFKRIWRILNKTTPVRIDLYGHRMNIPIHSLWVIPVVILLIFYKKWFLLKLIAFIVPTSLTALLVYCERGTYYYSIYHLFVAAIIIAVLVEISLLYGNRIMMLVRNKT